MKNLEIQDKLENYERNKRQIEYKQDLIIQKEKEAKERRDFLKEQWELVNKAKL